MDIMVAPLFALVLLGGGLALLAWWLLMLVEALKVPAQRWTEAGHNQLIYVLGMFLLGVLGTMLYVFIPRRDLRAP